MAIRILSNISNTFTVEDIRRSQTLENIKPFNSTAANIILGTLVTTLTLLNPSTVVDIKPSTENIQNVNYARTVQATSILPFRLTITNVGIEGYSPSNPPGIGIQVIGFSNYII